MSSSSKKLTKISFTCIPGPWGNWNLPRWHGTTRDGSDGSATLKCAGVEQLVDGASSVCGLVVTTSPESRTVGHVLVVAICRRTPDCGV